MDVNQLHKDIRKALPLDPIAASHVSTPESPRWQNSPDGHLLLDNRIYVPDIDNLRLRILQHKHDHVISGHLGQNKTIELIRREYIWPGLRSSVKDYCKSCTTCM